MVLKQLYIDMQKSPSTKTSHRITNSKRNTDLKVKYKTSRRNKGENLHVLGLHIESLDVKSRAQYRKEKN